MRKINQKLLLGLLLGTLFATGAVFGIHRFQYDRIADSLLWQARRAEEQGQVKKQARYLQRYLEFHTKDLEQKAQLAKLWAGEAFAEALKERRRAVHLLDDVLAQGDDQPELRRLLVKLALEVKQFKMARNHLEKLLTRAWLENPPSAGAASEQTPDVPHGECAGYAGQLLESENQAEKARRCYLLALHHAPKIENNYLLLAVLLRRQDQFEPAQYRENVKQADQTIERLVENNPHSHEALLTRWNYRREFGLIQPQGEKANEYVSLAEAARDVAEALRLAPESLEALIAAADLERFQARMALMSNAAAEEKEKSRQQYRDKALAYLEQGLTLHAKKERPAGVDTMGFRLLWHKANLLLDDREWREDDGTEAPAEAWRDWNAQMVRVLEQIRATRGSRPAIDFLQGRLVLLEHRWSDAADLLEEVRPALVTQHDLTAQINRCLGKAYEQLGKAGPMFEAYQRLADLDPYSTIAQIGMARAEWMLGHLDKAAKLFHQLHAGGRMPSKLYLDYTRLEIQRQGQEQRPDWVGVEKLMNLTEKLNPQAVETTLLRAQLSLASDADGKTEAANGVLREAQKEKGGDKHIELWIARIQLNLFGKNKNFAAARELLGQAKKSLGERVPQLRVAEARILAEEKGKQAEAAIEHLADDVEQFSKEDEKSLLLSGLADIQMNLDNLAAARRLWQRVAQLPSKRTDLSLQLLLFDLASKAEDENGIQQSLESIRSLEGVKGPIHRYGEALRLIVQARKESDAGQQKEILATVEEKLRAVGEMRPNWPAVFLARAQVELLSQRVDGAIRNLRLAKENGDNRPMLVRQMVELLIKVGRYDEADAELKRVQSNLLVHSDLGRIAASVAAERKDFERAGKLFDLNRGDGAGADYRKLLWDGRMLAVANRAEEAEAKLRAAQKAAPREAEPYVALVQFLVQHKRDKEAEAILDTARQSLPADEADLTLGHCYDLLGHKEKAQKCYEAALRGHRQNASVVRRVAGFYWNSSQMAETEPLLREIVDKRVRNASSDDVKWARWHLALVLAGGPDYRRFREALTLVGLKLDDKGQLLVDAARQRAESSDTRRFQARVLASQANHRAYRQYAVELLEELDRNKALPPEDRFILAMLYETDNDWNKAKPILIELTEQKDPAPRHLAYYVQMLLENKELKEAEKALARLEALEEQRAAEPNAFAAVELRARLYEEHQQGDKALKLLEAHIQRKGANPDELLLLLNSLHRQKKFAQAFARCLQAWKENKCTPEMLGGAGVAILREMQSVDPPTADQVSALESHLQKALADQPKNVALMLHLAELYDRHGRWQDAEKMYRRVLEPDNEPKNMVALNNLAWLLAQHSNDARKYQEALVLIEEAVDGIGRRADLMDTRGLIYLKLGQNENALADFREAVANVPTAANLFHLACAHYKVHDKNNAAKVLKHAQEQGLQANNLHPSEQDEYQKLLLELKIR